LFFSFIGFSYSYGYFLSYLSLLLFCVFCFFSSNVFFIYLFYEASLIPIIYMIVK
jgi:NADH:ubiquinone oxidoreductase subunit 4 (subunit M)